MFTGPMRAVRSARVSPKKRLVPEATRCLVAVRAGETSLGVPEARAGLARPRVCPRRAPTAGAAPAVVTAMMKYQTTEVFRKAINDGMDILGGNAISRGPRNPLAAAYIGAPVSITVLTRCPNSLPEVTAARSMSPVDICGIFKRALIN